MNILRRRSSWWVLANIAGILAYLKLASALWVQPGEEGTPGGPGDAFYWLFLIVPVLVAFLVFNSAVLFVIARRIRAGRTKASLAVWFAFAGLWVGAVAYDHHKSYNVIDAQYGIKALVQRDA